MKFTRLAAVILSIFAFVNNIATAQNEPRLTQNSNYSTSITLPIPFTTIPNNVGIFVNTALQPAIDETDPLHPCHGNDIDGSKQDSAGSYSIFTRIIHPGGVLVISSEANYDTVMSIFNSIGGLPNGAPVACNDDDATLFTPNNSKISQNLPAGEYVVMISRYDPAPVEVGPVVWGLVIRTSYTPDTFMTPNDDSGLPTPITIGVAYTQTDVHHTSDNAFESSLNSACMMYNSVWYQFIAPTSGYYQFTTFGSSYLAQPSLSATSMGLGIYTDDPIVLTQCRTNPLGSAVSQPIFISQGQSYLLRVGTVAAPNSLIGTGNMLPNSRYRIKAIATGLWVHNDPDFTLDGVGWATKNWAVGDLFTNGTAVMNATTVKKVLTQGRSVFPSYYKWQKGAILELNSAYAYTGTATGKLTIKVTYTDGRKASVLNVPIVPAVTGVIKTPLTLPSAKVKKITVSATLNPGSGVLTLDSLYVNYVRDSAPARSQQSRLPFPSH